MGSRNQQKDERATRKEQARATHMKNTLISKVLQQSKNVFFNALNNDKCQENKVHNIETILRTDEI